MRLREREMPLDPEVERELEAIDHALAGEPVDPDLEGLAELARELRERASPPSPASRPSSTSGPRTASRARAASRGCAGGWPRAAAPRLAPAGAAATLFVVVGVGGLPERRDRRRRRRHQHRSRRRTERGGADPAAGRRLRRRRARAALRHAARPPSACRRAASGRNLHARPPAPASVPPAKRKIARSVDLALSTAPDDFRDAADGVLDVVRDHRGFVVRSNVSGAIPTCRGRSWVTPASSFGSPPASCRRRWATSPTSVTSSRERDGTIDITSRFVAAQKRIDALTAAATELLRQLGEAVTLTEQESIRRAPARSSRRSSRRPRRTSRRRSGACTWCP